MSHPLDDLVNAHKHGLGGGITSICSAHPWVLKSALQGNSPVLIEATCNQVNQLGGYTGQSPLDFFRFVHQIARENEFPARLLLLGGDHLGPSPWQDQSATSAMRLAEDMVRAYVKAGFCKIHLDASMRLGDDNPGAPLDLDLVTQRTVLLARAAESVADPASPPRYVIGSEVPIPGGATAQETGLHVTSVRETQLAIEALRTAFMKVGLESAWERVIALVVQPGVEFGDDFVLHYQPEKAAELASYIESTPFVFEAHSTDYQNRADLVNLVRDHFAILKVGPALTFAFREAAFALAAIENELIPSERSSHLLEVLERVMLRQPGHWQKYYSGTPEERAFKRKYSQSDRIRYYWQVPEVNSAWDLLLHNLGKSPLPLNLLQQHLPEACQVIQAGDLHPSLNDIIAWKIDRLLDDYRQACRGD